MNMASTKFNALFFLRFFKILSIILREKKQIILFLFLLFLCGLEQVVIYSVGVLPSKFYKTLGEKDARAFQDILIYAGCLIISIAVISSTVTFVSSVLYVIWRRALTSHLHSHYFESKKYYKINVLEKLVDNPDQRITQDVDRMCKQFSTVLVPVIISPFTIAYYTYQAILGSGYLGPVSIFIFFILASTINKFLMSPVVEKVFEQEREEGNFRFQHMQVRCHAESVAFLNAGKLEEWKSNMRLDHLTSIQNSLIRRQYLLSCLVKLCDYIGSILSYVILSIPIFAGQYDDLSPADLSQLISKNAFVCIYLISCFTKLLDQAVTVTDVAGTAHRVGEMLEVLNRVVGEDETPTKENNENESSDNDDAKDKAFDLENIAITPPGAEEPIIKNLSVTISTSPSQNLLITGESGSGKSSVMRVLATLWSVSSGEVRRYLHTLDPQHIFYLPQTPYLTTGGTLRQQISLPYLLDHFETGDRRNNIAGIDADIISLLHLTHLSHLLSRCGGLDSNTSWNWYDVLSPGEQQRLAFVRLFFHKPKLAVLDEATSALSLEMEGELYVRCAELDIALVSVGHRASLSSYHRYQLHINSNTKECSLREITTATQATPSIQ